MTKFLAVVAISLGCFVAVPAFACDGHEKAEKTACGACGTEKCACGDKKDGESCDKCGTEACTCGKKEDTKKS